jgi:hypothetical protein
MQRQLTGEAGFCVIEKSFLLPGFQETGDDSTVKRVDYRSANLTP